MSVSPRDTAAIELVLHASSAEQAGLQDWLADLRRVTVRMSEHLGAPGDTFDRAIELRLVGDFAEQGRRIRELGPAVLRDGRLHLVLDLSGLEADSDIIRHELARLLIRRAGWRLPPAIEDGAALWLAQTGQPDSAATVWYGRSWRQWLPELVAMDVLPSTDELLMTERPYDGSRVLWTPVAAAVVDALEGETLARKLDPMPSPKAGRDLVAGVLRELETSANQQTPSRSHPAVRRAGRSSGGFQNGVAFAMANGVDTGYHAPSAERRLDLLRGLGVDSVSVMPFAYQRNPEKPAMAFLNRHPASETDVGVIHAARQAKKRGMTVMWKPHLWIGHHSWPGDVTMGSEADWSTWFHVYRRYVVHHAVLAEHAGADWFAIGVELGQTVHRETEWRHLIGSVRRVYSGHLTYAGNWWGDYDKVPFWDALDAVGIDAYFPLSDDEDADLATLRRGARNVVSQLQAAAERWDRPVLLTEVGFAARRSPWASPHEEGGTVSEVDQRLAWQVLLSELGKPSWLLGLHAWKVFTHPRGEGLGKPDFRFVGRPAQQVLEAYFRTEPGVVSVDLTGR